MTKRERITLWRWGFLMAAVIAAVLGFLGFLAQQGWQLNWEALHAAALNTMQMFFLNLGADNIKNVPTRLASLIAPMAAAGIVILAFLERLKGSWRFASLALWPADEVFLGCGDTAAAILAHRYGASPSARCVVGLDCAADTPFERALVDIDGEASTAARAPKAWAFRGDALSSDDLNAINAVRTRAVVWVLTGDDLRNVEIVQRLIALRQVAAAAARRKCAVPPPVTIVVSVYDTMLARAVQGQWNSRPGSARVEIFNLPRFVARILLQRFPPVYPKVPTDESTPQGRVHLCVIGESDFAPALLVHAAMHCVYSENPADCVHLTWIGVEVSARLKQLYLRYPALDPANERQLAAPGDPKLAGLLPLATITALDADPSQITPGQWSQLQEGRPFGKIYVMADNDWVTKIAARRALALQDVFWAEGLDRTAGSASIVTCLNGHLADLGREGGELPPAIESFKVSVEFLHPCEEYPGERFDKEAKAVDWAYGDHDPGNASYEEIDKANTKWLTLSDDFRWSCRYSADHFDVKLAILGRKRDMWPVEANRGGGVGQSLPPELSDAEKTLLKRIEHRRFIAERLIESWLPLAKEETRPKTDPPSKLRYKRNEGDKDEFTQKDDLRLNDTLIPFDALSSHVQAYDSKIVAVLSKLRSSESGELDPGQT